MKSHFFIEHSIANDLLDAEAGVYDSLVTHFREIKKDPWTFSEAQIVNEKGQTLEVHHYGGFRMVYQIKQAPGQLQVELVELTQASK